MAIRIAPITESTPRSLTSIVVWGVSAVNPALTALAGLLIARGLPTASYGQVAYFFAIYGLVVTFGSMGLSTRVTLDVARLLGEGNYAAATETARTLLTLRLATLAAIIGFSCAAAVFGNLILASAGFAGSASLATGFLLGIIQALGKPRGAAFVQACQVLLYLVAVIVWASSAPERVFIAVIASWSFALLAAIPACRSVLMGWAPDLSSNLKRWKRALLASGQVYVVTLLLAPFSVIAVLILGTTRRFEAAALLSVSLTLTLALSAIEATILQVQYEPRLCHLLGSSPRAAFEWFDGFYRAFASLAIVAIVILACYPGTLITLLYTEQYAAATDLLTSLAAGAGFLALGQFMLWTLFAHGRARWAFAGALAQLLTLIIGVGVVVGFPTLPLYWLGIGHTIAAGAGLTVCAIGIKRLAPWYGWHIRQLTMALAVAFGAAMLLKRVLPTGGARIETLGVLASVGVVVGAVTVAFLAPTIWKPLTKFSPLARIVKSGAE